MDLMKYRFEIIHELASRKPGLGKTALMKYLFVLQEVFKLPLRYEFEIYTYGPYSSEVMEDIDIAKIKDIISVSLETYPTGHIGYRINSLPLNNKDYSKEYTKHIKDLIEILGDKTAKELELSSTIIYAYKAAKNNSWEYDEISIANDVHEIKPHFSIESIIDEYKYLEEHDIFSELS